MNSLRALQVTRTFDDDGSSIALRKRLGAIAVFYVLVASGGGLGVLLIEAWRAQLENDGAQLVLGVFAVFAALVFGRFVSGKVKAFRIFRERVAFYFAEWRRFLSERAPSFVGFEYARFVVRRQLFQLRVRRVRAHHLQRTLNEIHRAQEDIETVLGHNFFRECHILVAVFAKEQHQACLFFAEAMTGLGFSVSLKVEQFMRSVDWIPDDWRRRNRRASFCFYVGEYAGVLDVPEAFVSLHDVGRLGEHRWDYFYATLFRLLPEQLTPFQLSGLEDSLHHYFVQAATYVTEPPEEKKVPRHVS
jgi:hypothetical protein